ncbi:MAG TPA: hypothetical protein VK841_14015 [Polyangiaceae bacterium]|nr:hypothetical protein [Polyangiaceae bacterium]
MPRPNQQLTTATKSALAVKGKSIRKDSPLAQMVANAAPENLQAATPPAPTDLGTFVTQALATGLEALAKLVADRAQREVVEFFLDKMRSDICLDPLADGGVPPAESGQPSVETRAELTEFWFPATCALTLEASPSTYGTGAAQLNALRAALTQDVRSWPGEFVGLGVGAGLGPPDNASIFSCDTNAGNPSNARCVALTTLRADIAKRVNGWIDGQSGLDALYGMGTDIDDENRHVASAPQYALYSDPIEVVGCLAAMPQIAHNYRTLFDSTAGDSLNATKSNASTAEALVLTAAASAPACWSIFGLGIQTNQCAWFQGAPPGSSADAGVDGGGGNADAAGASGGPAPATGCSAAITGINASTGLERLSTIARLGKKASPSAEFYARVLALEHAISTYTSASTTAPASQLGVSDAMAPPGGNGGTAASVVLQALGVTEAAVDLAASFADTFAVLSDRSLTPGLGGQGSIGSSDSMAMHVKKAKLVLLAIHDGIAVVRDFANQDWSSAIVRAAVGGDTILREACGTGCSGPLSTVVKYAGVVAAIVTAKDADQLAQVLDEAADPPGGWKDKQVPGRYTVSVTSEAGIFTALELRHGAYGVIENNFEKAYGQAPTLSLPIGIEFAWGTRGGPNPLSLYLPIIDPAAFLQYDAAQNGRLPGPGVLTALSPGVGLRFGIGGSPFGIMPMVVYRPALRAWDPAVAKGADALQFGLNFDVDVTLFKLAGGNGQ